jgi:phage gpG-like protein
VKARIIPPDNYVLVLRGMESIPKKVLEAGARGLKRGLEHAVTVSQREFFHEGTAILPNTLRAVTGQLRRRIVSSVDAPTERGVIGRIGNNLPYARYHEFGFRGAIAVNAHTRAIGVEGRKDLIREGVVLKRESGKSAAKRQKGGSTGVVFVSAYTRTVNYRGRPFLSPALQKSQPVILKQINDELKAVVP